MEINTEEVDSYLKDAERASGIMGGSLISRCLEKMLKDAMINDPIINELFDSYHPLSTLAARIDCAYAFGLINKQTKDDLHYIRKIRNEFAHTFKELSYNDSPIRDWCQELSAAKNKEIKPDDPSDVFGHTINKTMMLLLLQRKNEKKSPNTKPSE